MSYQVLARRSRPQLFDEVVGQESVVQALTNALRDQRIAQAYLFSGIRGVGKTSVARILAKALNCPERVAGEPCDNCDNCKEITAGSSIDVIEVDAATYSKVDQIRDLTDGLQYGPSAGSYKVVILDEVHRLSRQAFDALLKIVEEPPPHLVFIFATTAVDAVPATILSRCQEFSFRRVPADLLTAHLEKLCNAESLSAAPGSLRRIARAAEGSVRDAVALLDQMATLGDGAIDDTEVARLLGGLDLAALAQLFAHVATGNATEISSLIAEIRNAGRDPRRIYTELLSYAREALHLSAGVGEDCSDLPADEVASLAAVVNDLGYHNVLRLVQHLLESEPLLRQVDSPFLAFELALLRAAELPRLSSLETLLSGQPPEGQDQDATAQEHEPRPKPKQLEPEPAEKEQSPPTATAEDDSATLRATSAPTTSPADATTGGQAAADSDQGPETAEEDRVQVEAPADDDEHSERQQPPVSAAVVNPDQAAARFVELVQVGKPSLASHLVRAEISLANGQLSIAHAPDDQLLVRAWGRPGNQKIALEAAQEVLGSGATVALIESEAVAKSDRSEGETEEANHALDTQGLLGHPQVQTVLDIFNGEVSSVSPRKE